MNYEPGTVAVATVRGVPNVRVAYADPKDRSMPWMALAGVDAGRWAYDSEVTDVRPLVVLDLQDDAYGSPARVVAALRRCPTRDSVSLALADQIEAQTKPPQPTYADGTIAKVTAKKPKSASVIFAEWTGGAWRHAGGAKVNFGLGGIEVVEIIRPGIEDES